MVAFEFIVTREYSSWLDEVCMNKRIVQDFFSFGFAAFGVIWTILVSFDFFFEGSKPEGACWYAVIVLVSVATGLSRCWPRQRVTLQIPGSDSSIEIKFGDIFEGAGIAVIPVNEYFDGSLGDHVSKNSLHGTFIKDVLGGQSNAFVDLTRNALASVSAEEVTRKSGKGKKYPIGTVAPVDINQKRFLLTALSRTDLKTLKASATVHELWDCLAGIWQGVRNFSNGNCVKIPLLGSGLSGVGLPPKHLIEIILTSFLYYTKKEKIADKVSLVLPSRLKGEIDLETIKRSWT